MLSPHFWDGFSGMFLFCGSSAPPCALQGGGDDVIPGVRGCDMRDVWDQGGAESKFKAFILQ